MAGKRRHRARLAGGLRELIGKECWKCAASETTGSTISLHFGRKIPYPAPPGLPGKIPTAEGEFIIFINGAAWRLDCASQVVCGGEDALWNFSAAGEGLGRLIGRKVRGVRLVSPLCDLEIEFPGRIVLRVFCTQTGALGATANYSLEMPTEVIVVGGGGVVSLEAREQGMKL